jgi:DNA-binding Lrp family transcriptional regulator
VTHAIVLIRAARGVLATLGGDLMEIDGVAVAYSVTGDWDFVAILRVRDADHLRQVMTGRVSQLEGVVKTRTMVAFEAYSHHDLESVFTVGE